MSAHIVLTTIRVPFVSSNDVISMFYDSFVKSSPDTHDKYDNGILIDYKVKVFYFSQKQVKVIFLSFSSKYLSIINIFHYYL